MSIDVAAVFEKYMEDEFLKFERIAEPLSKRPDVHAFLMLDRLIPGTRDLISASEHDEYFLDIDVEVLAQVATEEQIRDLVRCGVRHSDEYDCLAVFA